MTMVPTNGRNGRVRCTFLLVDAAAAVALVPAGDCGSLFWWDKFHLKSGCEVSRRDDIHCCPAPGN